ncbi:helix-turn-helix domain-containing protein [Brevibacillus daliensis]|uniref:helix-turn-helix domain-containing protein n=1 Tax=Brevibacillus daliensis TaxID=2892995 RepID=UPI001E518EA0|nr:helix-turn-helix transcriptional regulator [Brevibacillus daliensis]
MINRSETPAHYTTIGEIVQKYRLQEQLTITQLANLTGISKGVISKIETEETRRPELRTMRLLIQALFIPEEEIMDAYLKVEQRTEIIEELLDDAISSNQLCLVQKLTRSLLSSPQEETDKLLEKLYHHIKRMNHSAIQIMLCQVMIDYAREHGMQVYVAKGLLHIYLSMQDRFSSPETYHTGISVLFYDDLLHTEERILLHETLLLHAFYLGYYEVCISSGERILKLDQEKNERTIKTIYLLFHAHYLQGNFQKAAYYEQLYPGRSQYSLPEYARLMKALLILSSPYKNAGLYQLKKCLTYATDKTFFTIMLHMLETLLIENDLAGVEALLREHPITVPLQTDCILQKNFSHLERLLAHFYTKKGELQKAAHHYGKSIQLYSYAFPPHLSPSIQGLLSLTNDED